MTRVKPWRYRGDWRADLVALGILMIYGASIRTPLYGGFGRAVVVSLLLEPFVCLIAIGLRHVFERLHLDKGLTLRAVGLVGLLSMLGALCQAAIAKLVLATGGWAVASWSTAQSWVLPFSYYTFILSSWSLAHLWGAAQIEAAESRRRIQAAETSAMRAELQHLRHQLDPHFLFNALNGIAAEIEPHPQSAVAMVRELADYLRYSLDHRELALAPLRTEVEAIGSYLAVQKARFGDGFDYRIDIEARALDRPTPGFMLQPLVENAIKHGLKAHTRPLLVTVTGRFADDRLTLRVTNSGTLRPDWRVAGAPGVGLSVLMRRLELHYPGRQHFDLIEDGGTVVAVVTLSGLPNLT